MNHTSNYHLPQWVKEDRIMMDDFNQAMLTIDESLTSTKNTADGAAAKVTAVEKGANLVKLAGPLTRPSSGTITADLSGVDINQYRALIAVLHSENTNPTAATIGGLAVDLSGTYTYLIVAAHIGEWTSAISFGVDAGSPKTVRLAGNSGPYWSANFSCNRECDKATLYGIKA